VAFAVIALNFVFFVLKYTLLLLRLAIILSAILSWLFAFDVINHRNRFVNQAAYFLDRIVNPLLAPLRRLIPPLGGVDVTPIILIILISGLLAILPESKAALTGLLLGY